MTIALILTLMALGAILAYSAHGSATKEAIGGVLLIGGLALLGAAIQMTTGG